MKRRTSIAALVTLTLMACAPAHAKSVAAQISRVDPIYDNTTQHVPRQICENIQVPIYQTVQRQGDAAGGALLGMILGGILGKEITGDKGGKNAGVVIGGLIGADRAAGSQKIISGYQNQKQCRTVYDQVSSQTISGYKIWFAYNGMEGSAFTNHKYSVGQRINVNMGLSID